VSGLERFFWRAVDWLDYRVWNVRLRIIDALCGSEPETEADREQLRQDGIRPVDESS
jgi:hypothetical protein